MNYQLNHTFPPSMRIAGWVIAVLGVIFAIESFILALPVILLGGFIATAINGITIHVKPKTYNSYTSLFGIRLGKQKTLKGYRFVSIIKRSVSHTTYSRANVPHTSAKENLHEVCLLDHSHRRKLRVGRFTSLEKARVAAKEISLALEMKQVKYQPRLSLKSQLKRKI